VRWRRSLRATLAAAVWIAIAGARAPVSIAGPDGPFDFTGSQLKILSSDGRQTIGFTRFTVLRNGTTEEIRGETKYLDGERDSEDEQLRIGTTGSAPRLDSYRHDFYNADGTLQMADALDTRSGAASCARNAAGEMKLRKSQLEVPADSFAGASELMMVIGSLRQGRREVGFHAFACVPGPEIFSVAASLAGGSEHWPLYPGELMRLDLRPDLGALNILIAPFMPKMDAWFNPRENWEYVGGEFDRYFRGPHVLTVRVSPAD
jgi:hypothetical protein